MASIILGLQPVQFSLKPGVNMSQGKTTLPPEPENAILPGRKARAGAAIRWLAQAVGWCLLAAAGFEVLVRLTFYSLPVAWVDTKPFSSVPVENSFLLWGKEGFGWTRYAALREIVTPYEEGRAIIVLGDSHTEAWQVGANQKFTSVAEALLHQSTAAYDIRNFGFSSMAMGDYVSLAPLYIDAYDPAAVVIQLTTEDFSESFSAGKQSYFTKQDGQITGLKHRHDLSQGVLSASGPPELKHLSMLLFVANERYQQIKAGPPKAGAAAVFDDDLARQQMDRLVEAAGDTPLILLLLPYAPHIIDRDYTAAEPGYDQLLALLATYPQITVVDTYPAFLELAESGELPRGFMNGAIPGAGHLNTTGNEITGRLLAEAILRLMP